MLLAVLAAAGLLALAPALVRRYDAGERIAAERATSDARVLSRDRRKRTVPGAVPLNPPQPDDHVTGDDTVGCAGDALPSPPSDSGRGGWSRVGRARATSVRLSAQTSQVPVGETDVATIERRAWWRRRHRRILIGMLGLSFLELLGVIFVGPGFWVGFAGVFLVTLWYVRYLRLRALASARGQRKALPSAERPKRHLPRQTQSPLNESDPEWVEESGDSDSRWPQEPAPVDYVDDEDDEEPEDDSPVEPPRRRGGGIRGRSYESPAANV
ncbi:hypothetical protein AB0I28_15930 [Phytomonospora sp. NPDC050363]|uniref:hypothetical protein n=1 Tax=Phytomonospora sp. NPDC050363 TaxID=3155642 RepID=UPI0033D16D65